MTNVSDALHTRWLQVIGNWLVPLTMSALSLAACGTADEPARAEQAGQGPAAASQPAAAEGPGPAVQEIATYAGTGSPKFKGDGGPANAAGLFQPTAIAFDNQGNLFISADRRIRRVEASTGVITTVAGTGSSFGLGDGGPALEAALREVQGLAVDSSGNVFIADSGMSRIRKVDAATGVITTVAGGGKGNVLEKIFGDGGPATEALVKLPDDVAVDGEGNLYIATDNRIRKVDAATGIITTFAGTGERGLDGDGGPATSAGLAEPVGVELGRQGNVFIADRDNHRIRKVDGSTGIISTVAGVGQFSVRSSALYSEGPTGDAGREVLASAQGAGYSGDGGPAAEAMLTLPSGVAIGPGGDLFIADGVVRVRKVDAATGVITTVASSEPESSYATGKVLVRTTVIGEILSIAVNAQDEVFVGDYKNNRVHKISAGAAAP